MLAQDLGSQADRGWLAAELDRVRDRSPGKTMQGSDAEVTWVRRQLYRETRKLARAWQGNRPQVNLARRAADDIAGPGLVSSLDDPRVSDVLYGLALDKAESDYLRSYAAFQLAELRDPRAVGLLADRVNDTALAPFQRAFDAVRLAQLGDPRGMDSLEAMAHDQSNPDLALHAIEKMSWVDKQRALKLLGELSARVPWWRLTRRLAVHFVRYSIRSGH